MVGVLALVLLDRSELAAGGTRAGLVAVAFLLVPVFRLMDLYKSRVWLRPAPHLWRLITGSVLLLIAYAAVHVAAKQSLALSGPTAFRAAVALPAAAVARLAAVSVLVALARDLPVLQRRAVLLGRPNAVAEFARRVTLEPLLGVVFAGVISAAAESGVPGNGLAHIGSLDDLDTLVATGVSDAFVCWEGTANDELFALVQRCRTAGLDVHIVGPPFDAVAAEPWQREYDQADVASIHGTSVRGLQLAVKRLVDVAGSLALLLALSPLLLGIALAVVLTSPGPALYVSEPVGYQRRQFRFFKFRTMTHGAPDQSHRELIAKVVTDADGKHGKLRDDPRITRVGQFLRRYSLDELPQLFNVLRGEMSLVGPRPSAVYELENYRPWHFGRFAVRPGMTGLWQVGGRARVSFNQMVAMDLYYIENFSLWLDVVILVRTIPVVFVGRGGF